MTAEAATNEESTGSGQIPGFVGSSEKLVYVILSGLRRHFSENGVADTCCRCHRRTTQYFPIRLQHEDFEFICPTPFCSRCIWSVRLESGAAQPFWWTLAISICSLLLAAAEWWLPAALVLAGIPLVYFIAGRSQSDPWVNLRNVMKQHSAVALLLKNFPTTRVSFSGGAINHGDDPNKLIAVMDDSIWIPMMVQFLCTTDDLTRSDLPSPVLATMLEQLLQQTRIWVASQPRDSGVALQIDVALLPGADPLLKFQVRPRQSVGNLLPLKERIQALPPLPVGSPVVFVVRRCNHSGRDGVAALPPPFADWSSGDSEQQKSWVELAQEKIAQEGDEPARVLTADDAGRWAAFAPGDEELAFVHIAALLRDGRINDADATFQGLLDLKESPASLRFRYAVTLDEADQTERSAAICQQLIRDYPDFTEAHGLLAHVLLQMDCADEASRIVDDAPDEHRSAMFWFTAARVALQQNREEVALSRLGATILQDQEFAPAYLLRSEVLHGRQSNVQALSDIETYEKLAGMTLKSLRIHSAILQELGRADDAVEVHTEALRQHPDHPVVLLMRSDILADAGKLALALEDCDTVLRDYPDLLVALEMRARIHLEQDDADAALRDTDAAIQGGYETAQLRLYRGIAHIMNEDFGQALEDLNTACDLSPEHVTVRYHRARANMKLERTDEAVEDLNCAIRHAPQWTEPRLLRGFLALSDERLDDADADFQRVLELNETSIDAMRGQSLVLEARGKTQEALGVLDQALQIDPDHVVCRMDRSRILQTEQDYEAAQQDLDAAVSNAPDLLMARLSRAHLQMQRGEFGKARTDFDAILKDNPEFMPALIGRSVLSDYQGDNDQSQEDLDAAVEQSPEHADQIAVARLMMKATVAYQNELYDDAIEASTEALEISPDQEKAFKIRAGSYWYSEQFVESLQDYSHLIETEDDPEPMLYGSRGQVYAELGDFDQALGDLEKAVELFRRKQDDETGLAYCLNGLGRTLTGLDRMDEADAAFRESAALQPENAWLQFNRGLMFLARNDPESASRCFELSLQLKKPRLSPRKRARAEGFISSLNSES